MPMLEIFRWVLFHLLFISFSYMALAIRKDIGFQLQACGTTVQGRYLLADEFGYVCGALSVDPESCCCPRKGDQYSCQGCNLISQCCNSYEFCVSCCLNPLQTQKELAVQVKIAKAETAGSSESLIESRFAGIGIVVGRQGESRDSVCKLRGQSCVPGRLILLNQCEIMQKHRQASDQISLLKLLMMHLSIW